MSQHSQQVYWYDLRVADTATQKIYVVCKTEVGHRSSSIKDGGIDHVCYLYSENLLHYTIWFSSYKSSCFSGIVLTCHSMSSITLMTLKHQLMTGQYQTQNFVSHCDVNIA